MGEPLIDRRELSRAVRSGLRNGRRVGRKVWRSRAVTVLLVLVLAVAVRALSVRQKLDTQRWGAVRTVVVAKFSFAEGHRLEANDLAERPLPLAAIPDLALSTAKLAEGRTLRVPVTAGQVLSDLAIGAPKARALLGSIGPDRVAIAIPTQAPRPPVQLGDHIDVHPAAGPATQPLGAPAQPVGAAADWRKNWPGDFVVVAINEQAVTVAASPAQAQRLVEALQSGPVLVALRGR
jgi:Flp pilus assembly protein CpaB